ncbi:hypothetical protein [Nocardia cyriacigeorgica]|nr:hypothetical protein [Nocardia cyriacigeorgica]
MDRRLVAATGIGALGGFTVGYVGHRVVGAPYGTDAQGQLRFPAG